MSNHYPYFDFPENDRPVVISEPSRAPAPYEDGHYCLVDYLEVSAPPQLMRCDGDLFEALFARDGQWLMPLILRVDPHTSAAGLRERVHTALAANSEGHEVVLDFRGSPNPSSPWMSELLGDLYIKAGVNALALSAQYLGGPGWTAWHRAAHKALDRALVALDQAQSA